MKGELCQLKSIMMNTVAREQQGSSKGAAALGGGAVQPEYFN